MIQGDGSDEAEVGNDYRWWDLMKHRQVGGKHEGRVMITGGGS